MVIHTCEVCKKNFNKKSHYVFHISKKKTPCVANDNINQNSKILHQEQDISTRAGAASIKINDDKNNNEVNIEEHNDNKKLHYCVICKKDFTRESSLKRHLLSRCKMINNNNNNINIENDNKKDDNIIKIVNELKEENNALKKMIMELATNAKTNNTNNGTIKNCKMSINKSIFYDGTHLILQILMKI